METETKELTIRDAIIEAVYSIWELELDKGQKTVKELYSDFIDNPRYQSKAMEKLITVTTVKSSRIRDKKDNILEYLGKSAIALGSFRYDEEPEYLISVEQAMDDFDNVNELESRLRELMESYI